MQSVSPRPSPLARRRAAMLKAAYDLFVERGYGAVSVDDIIRVSGGSKTTLYKLFGSKDGIMRAVIASLAEEMLKEFQVDFDAKKSVRDNLTHIGEVLIDLALSENAIAQFRMAVGNAKPFPEIAMLWYEAGPKSTFVGIAEFFERENARGTLRVPDPVQAADFFGGMILFRENMIRLIGGPESSARELKAMVSGAVDLFLRAYAT